MLVVVYCCVCGRFDYLWFGAVIDLLLVFDLLLLCLLLGGFALILYSLFSVVW